jgi:hypothetical protein
MCNDDWKYDDGHDMFEGPIDENPIGVDGLFCG